jgi:hypothetical protein
MCDYDWHRWRLYRSNREGSLWLDGNRNSGIVGLLIACVIRKYHDDDDHHDDGGDDDTDERSILGAGGGS